MAAAVLPLRLIAAEGVAVLFPRHDRKGERAPEARMRLLRYHRRGRSRILHPQRKTGGGTEGDAASASWRKALVDWPA